MENPDLESSILKIERLLDIKRFDEARTLLSQNLAEHPEDEELLSLVVLLEYSSNNLEDAEANALNLLNLHPHSVSGRYYLAQVNQDQKKYAQTEKLLIELINEFPEEPLYYTEYSWTMLYSLHLEKAEKLAQEALRLQHDYHPARLALVCASLIRSNSEEAKANLKNILEENPDDTETLIFLCATLAEQKHFKEALELGTEILENNPDNEDLLDLVLELQVTNHPLMAPLIPFQKFGWLFSIGLWVFSVTVAKYVAKNFSPEIAWPIILLLLAYPIYSWIGPSITKKWIKSRGI